MDEQAFQRFQECGSGILQRDEFRKQADQAVAAAKEDVDNLERVTLRSAPNTRVSSPSTVKSPGPRRAPT